MTIAVQRVLNFFVGLNIYYLYVMVSSISQMQCVFFTREKKEGRRQRVYKGICILPILQINEIFSLTVRTTGADCYNIKQ